MTGDDTKLPTSSVSTGESDTISMGIFRGRFMGSNPQMNALLLNSLEL